MFKDLSSIVTPAPVPSLEDVCPSGRREDGSVPCFPLQEDVPGCAAEIAVGKIEAPRKDAEVCWLNILGRSFGTFVRLVDPEKEPNITGGGLVCRALDTLCGWRAGCSQVHRAIHGSSTASGCLQRIRCPLGFYLVSVPVRARGTWIGQLEFGPFSIDQIDRVVLERGLGELDPALVRNPILQASLGAVRAVRAEDLEGVVALVERVAVEIGIESVRKPVNVQVREPEAVVAGRRYAELYLGGKISLADVARHVALSADHFSRLFRGATGLAFGEYVNRCRVASARRLLLETPRRVSEISFACGFDSVPHFNRVFRRISGMSPTCFRRQERNCATDQLD